MRLSLTKRLGAVLGALILSITVAPPALAAADSVDGYIHLDRATVTTDPYQWGTFVEVAVPGCYADLNFQVLVGAEWKFLDKSMNTGSDLTQPESERCIESTVRFDPKDVLRGYLPPSKAPELRSYGPTWPGFYTIRVIAPPDRRPYGAATRDEYGTWRWNYKDVTAAVSDPITVTVVPFTARISEWSPDDQWVQAGSAREHLFFSVTTLEYADVRVLLEEKAADGSWSTIDSQVQTDEMRQYAWPLPPRNHDTQWRIRIPDTDFMDGDVSDPQRVRVYPDVRVTAKLSRPSQTVGDAPASITISTSPGLSGVAHIARRVATSSGWLGTSLGEVEVVNGRATFTLSSHLAVGTYNVTVSFTPDDYPISVDSAEVQLNVLPAPNPITTAVRLFGQSRYETAVAVSRDSFAAGVPVAYIANGATFPDALSGAAAAGMRGGPVLLSTKDVLPSVVQRELARLQPKSIVLLGGKGVLSDRIRAQADDLTAGDVLRLGGATRFETSAAISRATYTTGVPVAYIASGMDFPDALSGAAAAGALDGPILLSSRDGMTADIRAELRRLRPEKIVLLGGPRVLSESVLAQARELRTAQIERRYGASRFDTAVAVSRAAFASGAPVVYVADGLNFPDALAGAATAGRAGGPVLLTRRDSIDISVLSEIRRLSPDRIVVLGGAGAVSNPVMERLKLLAADLN